MNSGVDVGHFGISWLSHSSEIGYFLIELPGVMLYRLM